MQFDQIILSGSNSIKLFDRRDPLSTPYVTRTIDGLGPTEADVSLARTAQGSGIYLGRRPQLRVITFNLNLNPNYFEGETPEILRERIYNLRSNRPDNALMLRLYSDGVEVANTPVYVKRIEVSPFSKDNVMQITLESPDEYLKHPTDYYLPLKSSTSKTNPTFTNIGSAPVGFRLRIWFDDIGMYSFGLVRSDQEEYLTLKHRFFVGDILEIDTRIGSRGVRHMKDSDGYTYNILGSMDPNSTWLQLHPGPNSFQLFQDSSVPSNTNFTWNSLLYRPQYLGV